MNNWMKKLAGHYDGIRNRYPADRLLILFDIDGTILDMRYMIQQVLGSFDASYGTSYFKDLQLTDITVHESEVDRLLELMQIPTFWQEKILKWYGKSVWSSQALLISHRPFPGVMEVIQWFQIHPNTFVGLNTGRPECLRRYTLLCLNLLGNEYKVSFPDELLCMNRTYWEVKAPEAKADAIRHFREQGYRIFAMVDNEPENLKAVSAVDSDGEILLLHADTIFKSERKTLPAQAVGGQLYDLTELLYERALPRHIQFV